MARQALNECCLDPIQHIGNSGDRHDEQRQTIKPLLIGRDHTGRFGEYAAGKRGFLHFTGLDPLPGNLQ